MGVRDLADFWLLKVDEDQDFRAHRDSLIEVFTKDLDPSKRYFGSMKQSAVFAKSPQVRLGKVPVPASTRVQCIVTVSNVRPVPKGPLRC